MGRFFPDHNIEYGINLQKLITGKKSGEETFDKLDKNPSYDLVITDLRMHGATGVDVFKKSREINANVGVMVMSGLGSDGTKTLLARIQTVFGRRVPGKSSRLPWDEELNNIRFTFEH